MANSGVLSGKSFRSFSVNDDLLAKMVAAVKEGDSKARSTGKIQSFEVFSEGFRQHIVIGRLMVVPSKITDSPEEFPIALLYGKVVKMLNPEDIADMQMHKIGENEFDEFSKKDWTRVKEELFKNDEDKFASLIIFLPAWTNPREFVTFHMIKDEGKLAEMLAHQVFACYFDPRLSSAFDAILTDMDTTKLDVTDISTKLNFPFLAEGNEKEYPDFTAGDADGKNGGQSAQKRASHKKQIILLARTNVAALEDLLSHDEIDVMASLNDALTSALGKTAAPITPATQYKHPGIKDPNHYRTVLPAQKKPKAPSAYGQENLVEQLEGIESPVEGEKPSGRMDPEWIASTKTADGVGADFSGAKSKVVSPDDPDIKQPTESVDVVPKTDAEVSKTAGWGECKNCGMQIEKGYNFCSDECRDEFNREDEEVEKEASSKKTGRKMGKCQDCGKERSIDDNKLCHECWQKHKEDEEAEKVASAIGEDRTDAYHAASRRQNEKISKRESKLEKLRGKVADVPLTEDSIWSSLTSDFGPAPQIELPGDGKQPQSEGTKDPDGLKKALPDSTPKQEESAKPFNFDEKPKEIKIDKGDNTTPPEKSAPKAPKAESPKEEASGEKKEAGLKGVTNIGHSLPAKGTPEWHQLQIAIKTMSMPDAVVGVSGGPNKQQATETLRRYGLTWEARWGEFYEKEGENGGVFDSAAALDSHREHSHKKASSQWSMKCPQCGKIASKESPESSYSCSCGWNSSKKASKTANTLHQQMSEFNDLSGGPKNVAGSPIVPPTMLGGPKAVTEPQNATAIKDAMDTVAEQEIGKSFSEKAQEIANEVKADSVAHHDMGKAVPGQTVEVGKSDGGKIVININASAHQSFLGDELKARGFIFDHHGSDHRAELAKKYGDEDSIPDELYENDDAQVFTHPKGLTLGFSQDEGNWWMTYRGITIGGDLYDGSLGRTLSIKKLKKATVTPDAINKLTTPNMGQNIKPSMPIIPQNIGVKKNEEECFPVIEEAVGANQEHAVGEDQTSKEAGFNFFFPGQVLKEFYPELQHNVVDYPNDSNAPMQEPSISGGELETEEVEIPGINIPDEALNQITAFVSTSPAAGMGIGREGKPQVLDGAPLRKENDIRGPMFTDEFYQNTTSVPGKYLINSSRAKRAGLDDKTLLSDFLKAVVGEIAVTFVSAFKVTNQGVALDKVPGVGEVQLQYMENPSGLSSFSTMNSSRIKTLIERMNDDEIRDCVNDAVAQAAVWSKGNGGYTYEVYVRAESIDTDTMVMKYKFVTGTKR
jgi:hypothetical protein